MDGLQEIQNKAIEIAFFAVLTVLSDSILGDVLIHFQASVKIMQLENAYSPFRCVSPLLYYQYLWVGESGKSPWYLRGWRLWFYKTSNSPTPFLRTQNNVANFPLPRGGEANSSPCIPLVGPGSYPRGKPMTCALSRYFSYRVRALKLPWNPLCPNVWAWYGKLYNADAILV